MNWQAHGITVWVCSGCKKQCVLKEKVKPAGCPLDNPPLEEDFFTKEEQELAGLNRSRL